MNAKKSGGIKRTTAGRSSFPCYDREVARQQALVVVIGRFFNFEQSRASCFTPASGLYARLSLFPPGCSVQCKFKCSLHHPVTM